MWRFVRGCVRSWMTGQSQTSRGLTSGLCCVMLVSRLLGVSFKGFPLDGCPDLCPKTNSRWKEKKIRLKCINLGIKKWMIHKNVKFIKIFRYWFFKFSINLSKKTLIKNKINSTDYAIIESFLGYPYASVSYLYINSFIKFFSVLYQIYCNSLNLF